MKKLDAGGLATSSGAGPAVETKDRLANAIAWLHADLQTALDIAQARPADPGDVAMLAECLRAATAGVERLEGLARSLRDKVPAWPNDHLVDLARVVDEVLELAHVDLDVRPREYHDYMLVPALYAETATIREIVISLLWVVSNTVAKAVPTDIEVLLTISVEPGFLRLEGRLASAEPDRRSGKLALERRLAVRVHRRGPDWRSDVCRDLVKRLGGHSQMAPGRERDGTLTVWLPASC